MNRYETCLCLEEEVEEKEEGGGGEMKSVWGHGNARSPFREFGSLWEVMLRPGETMKWGSKRSMKNSVEINIYIKNF